MFELGMPRQGGGRGVYFIAGFAGVFGFDFSFLAPEPFLYWLLFALFHHEYFFEKLSHKLFFFVSLVQGFGDFFLDKLKFCISFWNRDKFGL